MVTLRDLLPGARRRKRKPRPDAPRTIVPPHETQAQTQTPAAKLDAARERLRRDIPPPPDEG